MPVRAGLSSFCVFALPSVRGCQRRGAACGAARPAALAGLAAGKVVRTVPASKRLRKRRTLCPAGAGGSGCGSGGGRRRAPRTAAGLPCSRGDSEERPLPGLLRPWSSAARCRPVRPWLGGVGDRGCPVRRPVLGRLAPSSGARRAAGCRAGPAGQRGEECAASPGQVVYSPRS